MRNPGPILSSSATLLTGEPCRWVFWLLGLVVLVEGALIRAQDTTATQPSSISLEAVLARPLSLETWAIWRESYLRIFDDDSQNPEKERAFYEQVRAFFGPIAVAFGGSLPKELETDPIAWSALSWTYLHLATDAGSSALDEHYYTLAEEASRKGIARGDPKAMGSYALAATLVSRGRSRASNLPVTDKIERGLREAEDRLGHVDHVSPQVNVNLWRGWIAEVRRDKRKASALFAKAVEDHPRSAQSAVAYLSNTMAAAEVPVKLAERTGPFVTRFPADAHIQALHATALYRDERYVEAADALLRARKLDEKVARWLGDPAVKAIEEGRDLTPQALSGLKAMKVKQYESAASAFRRALVENPANLMVARLLSRTLVDRLASASAPSSTLVNSTTSEIRALSHQFPREPEIQAALAAVLRISGRNSEAAEALHRAKALGGRPEQLFESSTLHAIYRNADSDRSILFWEYTAAAAVVGAVIWIGIMFAMGAILAVCIPRVPRSIALTGQARTGREVWLERFYLLVLSLGLLGFYLSVPLVAAGLLAVTLILFGLLLVIRIIHVGILQRGMWAFWNVLQCTLIGPQSEVLGIEATAEHHPRLFETLSTVADRLNTRPVDQVYLTPSSNIGVKQEGSGPFGLLGRRRRVLEIGISTLPLLSREEFQSILAHEYGHFSHNDTVYSRFIFQVSASLATSLAVMSAAGGFLNYINPFYWFWWLYLRAYTLLANGFSRSREFLADRQAAAAYGKQTFISGLTKVSVDGVLFESTIYSNIRNLLTEGKAFTNAFDAFRQFRQGTEIVASRERFMEQLRRAKPGWLDTHPTFSERLAAIAEFPDSAPTAEGEPAITLLSDPPSVEAKLTELLTSYVHARLSGVSCDLA
jgi:Zn-dependent protease with chaperone function/tetratricopeptide (TPR) repeat protein